MTGAITACDRTQPGGAHWSIQIPEGWKKAPSSTVASTNTRAVGTDFEGRCVLALMPEDGTAQTILFYRRDALQSGLTTKFFEASPTDKLPWEATTVTLAPTGQEAVICFSRAMSAAAAYPSRQADGYGCSIEFFGRDESVLITYGNFVSGAAIQLEPLRDVATTFRFDDGFAYAWKPASP